MRPFRDLKVHQRSHALVLEVYRVTRHFPREEMFGLTAQLRRAAVSIPTNIAEGSARGTDKDFRQFLYVALGSSAELEYLVLLARDIEYISAADHDALQDAIGSVKRMLVAFISRLSADEDPWSRRTGTAAGRTRSAKSQQPPANSQQPAGERRP
jgi:four helix bundle protein